MSVEFFIVDVFARQKYEGNQLAVFLDLDNLISEDQMLQMAQEINFAETTFIKQILEDNHFRVRIFTPEYEIPFAGHPCLGTSYIISKLLLPQNPKPDKIFLDLMHSCIEIQLPKEGSETFFMLQAPPEFRQLFPTELISQVLNIPQRAIHPTLPIQEITTGLPYIIIPLNDLNSIENIQLDTQSSLDFLTQNHLHKSNSTDQLTTAYFFFTAETYEEDNDYNTRMFCLENDKIVEDAATGSANGCLLAYLLKYQSPGIKAQVEQGFQMQRKSYLHLDGKIEGQQYIIRVGGCVQYISQGSWSLS